MFDFEMPLPAGVRISKGNWFHDRWITSELNFEFLTSSERTGLVLTFWNPDFSTQLLNNSMLISLAGHMKYVKGIKLGQTVSVDIELDAPLSEADVLHLQVENSLQPTTADARERAIILTKFEWV